VVSILIDNFCAQDFGEFMKVNRLAPMFDQLQSASSSKQPVDQGRDCAHVTLTPTRMHTQARMHTRIHTHTHIF